MSHSTLALVIGLFSITVVLLALALRQIPLQQKQPGKQVAAASVAPTPTLSPIQTTLSFLPETLAVSSLASPSAVNVVLDAGGNEITDVQLELTFDPDVLTSITIEPGTFFGINTPLLNAVDQKRGRISFAIGTTPSQTAKKGKGVVARITFLPISRMTTETKISFLTKTVVLAKDGNGSVLKASIDARILLFPSPTKSVPAPTKKPSITPVQSGSTPETSSSADTPTP